MERFAVAVLRILPTVEIAGRRFGLTLDPVGFASVTLGRRTWYWSADSGSGTEVG